MEYFLTSAFPFKNLPKSQRHNFESSPSKKKKRNNNSNYTGKRRSRRQKRTRAKFMDWNNNPKKDWRGWKEEREREGTAAATSWHEIPSPFSDTRWKLHMGGFVGRHTLNSSNLMESNKGDVCSWDRVAGNETFDAKSSVARQNMRHVYPSIK